MCSFLCHFSFGAQGPLHETIFFFLTYVASCNAPCAPKEKWHRKEHIIIIITIIIILPNRHLLTKNTEKVSGKKKSGEWASRQKAKKEQRQ